MRTTRNINVNCNYVFLMCTYYKTVIYFMGFLKGKKTELNRKSKLNLWLIKQYKTKQILLDQLFSLHRPEKKDNLTKKSTSSIMKGLSIYTSANLYKIYGINGVHEKLMIFCNCSIQMIIQVWLNM